MSAQLIDGKAFAEGLREKVGVHAATFAAQAGRKAGLAVVLVGGLMMVYVLFGGMTATTWVQIIKAVLLLSGVTFMGFMVMA